MKNLMRWRNTFSLSLVLSGSVLLIPAQAQQMMMPNANGSNSTFNTDAGSHSKPMGGANSGTLTAIPDGFQDLRLMPGVLMSMTVYDEPELATEARVDDKGDISLPLVGSIHVGGTTMAQARAKIQEKYQSAEILKSPQVTLNVLQYVNSDVTVLGEVQAPGRFPMLAPHSLQDVLGMAGGETNLAGDAIEVEGPDGRVLHTYHYVRSAGGNKLEETMIDPGDSVRVKRAGVVYVLGAVYRPGGYVMQEDGSLNVVQAVSLAQGTLMQAKIGGMRVIRRESDGKLEDFPIPYKKIMEGKEAPLKLEEQDIVYVPISKAKSVFTAGASIVGETSSAAIYAVK